MEKQEISINLKDAYDISCDECGSNYFTPAFQIKKLLHQLFKLKNSPH